MYILSIWGNKGDSTLKASEQNQLDFTKSLQGIFQQQFGAQKGILDYLQAKGKSMIENPQGYSQEALAGLRTGATENAARSFAQASQALHEQQAARGGSQLPSGVDAQLNAQNANAGAALNAQSQNQITQANEDLRQQNMLTGLNLLSGTANQYNPLGFAGAQGQTAGNIAGLGQAYHSSQQGFLSNLAGSLAGGFGQGFGSNLGLGASNFFGGLLGGNKPKN